ncbi:hypothetical protein GUJ93_ZPchr0010g7322 [Zizania palustris]|uniref:Uncharacterized protein n=1 Tax=Zizania palustris TaxID=103762 RepID=A0A8J5W7K9_ZIZPA|nr:hypothetical protein GUJ93_ZPchr0010g7322 [Zizania palustris]
MCLSLTQQQSARPLVTRFKTAARQRKGNVREAVARARQRLALGSSEGTDSRHREQCHGELRPRGASARPSWL